MKFQRKKIGAAITVIMLIGIVGLFIPATVAGILSLRSGKNSFSGGLQVFTPLHSELIPSDSRMLLDRLKC